MKTHRIALFTGVLLFVLPFFIAPAYSQDRIGQCEPATAEAFLDVGNVRARINNNGSLFQDGEGLNYEVPRGIGANSVYGASLWFSGHIDNALHVAASRYGPFEFWPGPLDEAGNPPADCSMYDKIWEIRSTDIDTFKTSGHITENLQNWPWDLGAPVIDGDGVGGNYNIAGGDLPAIRGNQLLWWIMNDRGNQHKSSNSKPIGLEVHASAFAFDSSLEIINEAFPDINNADSLSNHTFYDFKIIYKNDKPLTSAYMGMFTDGDLGNAVDDYVGTDSLHQFSYTYNADNSDVLCGYRVPPPAVGFTLFSSKLATTDGVDNNFDGIIDEAGEQLGISSMIANVEPYTKEMYRNVMLGRWEDGRPLLKGGIGREGYGFPENLPQKETRFVFPASPVGGGFWSEVNSDNQGTSTQASDRTLVSSMGQFDLQPGETIDLQMAVVWTQRTNYLESVSGLRDEVIKVRSAQSMIFDNGIQTDIPIPTESTTSVQVEQNYPNPFAGQTTLGYHLPEAAQVQITVFDMLGRQVASLVNQQQDAGEHTAVFNAANLPAGLYFARFQFDNIQITRQLTLIQ